MPDHFPAQIAHWCNRSTNGFDPFGRGAEPRWAASFYPLLSSKAEPPADNRKTAARYRQERPASLFSGSWRNSSARDF